MNAKVHAYKRTRYADVCVQAGVKSFPRILSKHEMQHITYIKTVYIVLKLHGASVANALAHGKDTRVSNQFGRCEFKSSYCWLTLRAYVRRRFSNLLMVVGSRRRISEIFLEYSWKQQSDKYKTNIKLQELTDTAWIIGLIRLSVDLRFFIYIAYPTYFHFFRSIIKFMNSRSRVIRETWPMPKSIYGFTWQLKKIQINYPTSGVKGPSLEGVYLSFFFYSNIHTAAYGSTDRMFSL